MKKTLIFSMTTAAGANTYNMNLISEDGNAKNQAQWVAPRAFGIMKVVIMGAAGSYVTLIRNSHASDNITLLQLADTIADAKKTINLGKILGSAGKQVGVEIISQETLTLTATVTGNATIHVAIELDDKAPVVNCRAIRVTGVNACIALTPVETGGLIPAGLNPNSNYKLRGTYIWSTTAQTAMIKLKDQAIVVPATNVILSGFGYTKLDDGQADAIAGSGAEFQSSFALWLTAVAADAAALATMQFGIIFSSS